MVGSPGREGSNSTVAYPMGESTVIWCSTALAPRLADLDGTPALSNTQFIRAATALGGIPGSLGRFRVLDGPPKTPAGQTPELRSLDRDDRNHQRLIADLVAECSQDDLDECELAMDDLDPVIVAALDPVGAIAALAFVRAWGIDADFDDMGVITRPDCRGRGYAQSAVAHCARQRQEAGRIPLYNCDAENLGSNRLAESLGFQLVQTVASVRFEATGDPSSAAQSGIS